MTPVAAYIFQAPHTYIRAGASRYTQRRFLAGG